MTALTLDLVAERVLGADRAEMELIADVYEALGYEVVRNTSARGISWKYRGRVVDVPLCDSERWISMDRQLFELGGAKRMVPANVGYFLGRGRVRPSEPLGGATICSMDGEATYAVAEHDREEHALIAAVLRYIARLREVGGVRNQLVELAPMTSGAPLSAAVAAGVDATIGLVRKWAQEAVVPPAREWIDAVATDLATNRDFLITKATLGGSTDG